jgi:hypothetical protein
MSDPRQPFEPVAWWRHGYVWMLVAFPAAAVVGGTAMLVVATRLPDPVVAADYYRRGIEINKTLAARDKALMPAQQGRNHAATPGTP